MATDDNSSLQATPGGAATFDMFARAIMNRTQINTNVALPCTVLAWAPPVSAGSESRPGMVRVRLDFKYARALDVPGSAAPTEEVRDHPTRGLLGIGTLPEIPNVPVMYLGPGGMQVRGPIEVGECGLVVFADRSIDDWIQEGGPVEPVMRHARHALIDAIFIPGLRYGTVAQPVDETLYFVGREDQTAGMSLHAQTKDLRVFTEGANAEIDAATSIKLGASATLGVARLNDAVSPLAAMIAWATLVETAINALAPGTFTPGVNSFATTVQNSFAQIAAASTKVTCE